MTTIWQDFIHSESLVQRKIAECSKKVLFCGDCCDRKEWKVGREKKKKKKTKNEETR